MLKIIILCVLLSLLFYELTDITPGGIIVPGLLLCYISAPIRIVYTIIISIITFLLVKFLSNRLAIYGKRRFALMILVSFGINIIVNLILGAFFPSANNLLLNLVGYTACGIIASNYFRQGIVKTSLSMIAVMGIAFLFMLVFGMV